MPAQPALTSPASHAWPALDYPAWRDTAATLPSWTQVVGKVRLALSPWLNHGWQLPLLGFLQSSYAAVAVLAGWNRGLECELGVPGQPPLLSTATAPKTGPANAADTGP